MPSAMVVMRYQRIVRASGEVAFIVAAALLYFAVRSVGEGAADAAQRNAERIVRLEKAIGAYHEPALQALIAQLDWATDLVNWIYIWGHWPFIAAVAIWLVWTRPLAYRRYRNAFLVSGGIGLVVFVLLPVAPPRLANLDLIDTITERSRAYRILQPPQFTNQYAAMPSLHFGWNLLIGIALVTESRRRLVQAIGVASPVLMAAAVVLTANHFILDAVAGAIVALLGLWLSLRGRRALARLRDLRRRTPSGT